MGYRIDVKGKPKTGLWYKTKAKAKRHAKMMRKSGFKKVRVVKTGKK